MFRALSKRTSKDEFKLQASFAKQTAFNWNNFHVSLISYPYPFELEICQIYILYFNFPDERGSRYNTYDCMQKFPNISGLILEIF